MTDHRGILNLAEILWRVSNGGNSKAARSVGWAPPTSYVETTVDSRAVPTLLLRLSINVRQRRG